MWIDRRENSKSLALSSVLLALRNIKKVGAVVDRPKALGDIRGVSYIYGMFYRFGLIDVPDEVKEKIRTNAVAVFRAVGGFGLSRVDFFVEQGTNEVIFNEINTLPGFTNISMYPMLWKAAGFEKEELLDQIIALAFER